MMTLIPFLLSFPSLNVSRKHYLVHQISSNGVYKRIFPYPYKAGLSISSDIDSTSTLERFLTIQEFLNTKNNTPMGVGVGLEIGNSFFPKGQRTSPFAFDRFPDSQVIAELIKLGYIDFIHSFNQAKDRNEIQYLTKLLSDNNLRLDVWVNHGNVRNNIGLSSESLGDKNGSSYYHTDFSIDAIGYRFVWEGQVSGIIGQGRPLDLYAFVAPLDRTHLLSSLYENVIKEVGKYILSFKIRKYSARRYNELVYPLQLADGRTVFGFVRSNVSHQGIWRSATAAGLADTLREDVLNKLVDSEGFMIIYTHLGKTGKHPYLPAKTQEALRLLENQYRQGKIYVATSARLLNYYVNTRYLDWRTRVDGQRKIIVIDSIADPVRGRFVPLVDDLQGVTFYTDDPARTDIFIREQEIANVVRNEADHTGAMSIMIPLQTLPKLEQKMTEYKKSGYF